MKKSRARIRIPVLLALTAVLLSPLSASAQNNVDKDVAAKLTGLDPYMAKTLKDWNCPGIGVAVVVGDQLVFSKGYGYRDYGKKLPYTPTTLHQIASNSKLFTAVAAGMLVDEGKLSWDKPVRESVPTIQFYDDRLNTTITLRDMLSHRTGIMRHDMIWYQAPDSRKELFDKLRYMEPKTAPRTMFLYNNMMYASAGEIIELQSGKTWEQFVRERILDPLEMKSTLYSVAEMVKQKDFGVGYNEKRDTFELYNVPYYEDTAGMAPAGAIISNLEDMSHWLIALMNDGKYKGKQVIPADVLKATLEPAIGIPNVLGENRGWWETVNDYYGMGRFTTSYRGHLLAYHGGDLDGFHSQVSFMPQDHIGVLVFVIGDHAAQLYDIVSYHVYETLLGMKPATPWSERWLDVRLKGKKADTEARGKAGEDRVKDTKPSHPLADYAGEYVNPAYGVLKIGLKDDALQFDFHKIALPMSHFHYDRFETPDDERYGRWSVNFATNPQGDIDKASMSLDEAEATFTRRPTPPAPDVMKKLAGTYVAPTGFPFDVVLKEDGSLVIVRPGGPDQKLMPYKGLKFRTPEFSDVVVEFVMENDQVTSMTQRDASGKYTFKKKTP